MVEFCSTLHFELSDMAGFMFFKDSQIWGEATQGAKALRGFKDDPPNGLAMDKFYLGWIVLKSVSQGIERAIEAGRSGTARARAGTVLQDVEVTKEVDKASMHLLQACAGGTPFPCVYIHLCTSLLDGNNEPSLHPFLEFRLFSCKVTSYEINAEGTDEGGAPTETLRLNFDRITWRYWPIGRTPKPDDDSWEGVDSNMAHDPILAGWDVLRSAPYSG